MNDLLDVRGKTILGIVAHPDDLDFWAAGSIASWAKNGANIYYIILTDGTRGSEDMSISEDDLREMRHREQQEAGKVVGIKDVFFLDFPDGALRNVEEVHRPVVKIIRQLKPDIVITTDPTNVYDEENGYINHPDHRCAGQIALDCVFPFARNGRSYPDLLEEGHEIHSVDTVLLNNMSKANHLIDITETFEQKLAAIKCHESQFGDFKDITERVTKKARALGEMMGVEFAEAFVKVSSIR